jgi:putative peptide zinc metalloprotease protein
MVKNPPSELSDSFQVRDAATAKLKLRTDLIFTPQQSGGRPFYLIEDPLRSKFFRLGVAEYALVSLFDGRTTIVEALRRSAAQLGPQAFTECEALAISRWLVESQLATTPESAGAARVADAAQNALSQRHAAAVNPLAIRFRLFNPDRLLDTILPWTRWLLGWPALAVWCVVLLLGIATAAMNWAQLADRSLLLFDPGNWLRLAIAWTALKIIHESFHALACKKFGGNVVRAGVMLLFFAPVAYTDVTSSWRCRSKWQRIMIAGAGIYSELFVATLAVLYWAHTSDGMLHQLAFDVLLMASLSTVLFNINPLLRFDGYYILSDLLGIPNLYSQGRQAVIGLLKRYGFGQQIVAGAESSATNRLILAYGLGALVWQGIIYLSFALIVIGALSYLGSMLAGAFLMFAIALPILRIIRETLRTGTFDRRCHKRLIRTALVGTAIAMLLVWILARPGSITAPAVVEYAPATSIRAATAGFVREIRVESGDVVQPGQIIAVLENPELNSELAELKVSSAQAALRARICFAAHEVAKYQMEIASRVALEQRVRELDVQVTALTIRSPTRGHVVGRQLRGLVGQYLKAGAEIALVGDEDAKELIVALAQDDLESFRAELGAPVSVRIQGLGGERMSWELARIDPQAGLTPPHAALSSRVQGPLMVKMRLSNSSQGNTDLAEHDELLRPCFKATVRIPAGESRRLHAGQKATINFSSQAESSGAQLKRKIRSWVNDQYARAKAPRAGPAS